MVNRQKTTEEQIDRLIKSTKELSKAYEGKQEVFTQIILEAENLISGFWTMTETAHEQTKDDMIHSLETISDRVNTFQDRNGDVIQLIKAQKQARKLA